MSHKISEQGLLNTFKEFTIQKRWLAIALLITSIVVFGALAILGGLSLFSSYNTFSHVLNIIGHRGTWAAFISGGISATIGTIIAVALLINKGRSPLHRAIENRAVIGQYLQVGDVNKPDHNGDRPLHYAILNGHALNELLSQEDVDVNAKNHNGYTPLTVAVRAGKKESVEKLLAQPEVNLDIKTIIWAISYGSDEIVTLLLASMKCNGPWKECLFEAVEKGKKEHIDAILKKYNNPNHQDLQDAFVLAAYCHRGSGSHKTLYLDILNAFLNNGIDVNARSRQFWGRTALHQAANFNNIDLVCKLLKIPSIDVNIEDAYGKSPLELSMMWPWLNVAIPIIKSKKVSEKNLEIAKQIAERTATGKYGTDCGRVILAIDKCITT